MPKYKVLNAVAHNVAASFTSSMNYAESDFVMAHLLTHARESGESDFVIDFVSGTASSVFSRRPLQQVVPFYVETFWKNVQSQGSTRSFVKQAQLSLSFDIATIRARSDYPEFKESPYVCTLILLDDRGVDHSYTAHGWWSTEPAQRISGLRSWFMRLMRRFHVWSASRRKPARG